MKNMKKLSLLFMIAATPIQSAQMAPSEFERLCQDSMMASAQLLALGQQTQSAAAQTIQSGLKSGMQSKKASKQAAKDLAAQQAQDAAARQAAQEEQLAQQKAKAAQQAAQDAAAAQQAKEAAQQAQATANQAREAAQQLEAMRQAVAANDESHGGDMGMNSEDVALVAAQHKAQAEKVAKDKLPANAQLPADNLRAIAEATAKHNAKQAAEKQAAADLAAQQQLEATRKIVAANDESHGSDINMNNEDVALIAAQHKAQAEAAANLAAQQAAKLAADQATAAQKAAAAQEATDLIRQINTSIQQYSDSNAKFTAKTTLLQGLEANTESVSNKELADARDAIAIAEQGKKFANNNFVKTLSKYINDFGLCFRTAAGLLTSAKLSIKDKDDQKVMIIKAKELSESIDRAMQTFDDIKIPLNVLTNKTGVQAGAENVDIPLSDVKSGINQAV